MSFHHSVSSQDGITYIDHCWLPDGHFVAAKSNREVIIVDRQQARVACVMDRYITAITSLPDGGIAVAVGKGFVQLYAPKSKEEPHKFGERAWLSDLFLKSGLMLMQGPATQ